MIFEYLSYLLLISISNVLSPNEVPWVNKVIVFVALSKVGDPEF